MADATALPPCPDRLDPNLCARFRGEGYLAFRDLLTPGEVASACGAIAELAQAVSRAPRRGMIAQVEPDHDDSDAATGGGRGERSDFEGRLRKLMGYRAHDPVLAALAESHPKLHGVVASLLGPDPRCFQDMALIKPARIGSEKPWHQDAAYFDVLPFDAVVGVWIALDAATVDNGCMHVLPGAHRRGPLRHVHAPVLVPDRAGAGFVRSAHTDCQIAEPDALDAAARVRPIPLPPGGVVLFTPLLPHRTPPNHTAKRRRALQLHYRARDSRRVDRAAYDRAFVDATGRPASCHAAADG